MFVDVVFEVVLYQAAHYNNGLPHKKHEDPFKYGGAKNKEGEHEHGEEGGAVYDATNGTVSSGDLYYAGPGVGFL